MRLLIQKEHFFCLRNWALYSSLRIRLRVSYAGDRPDTEQMLDLRGGAEVPDGILMLIQPETEGTEVTIDLSNPSAKTENGVEVTVSGGHVTANN